ncbi:MAG: SPOR domain-containing protein, partial [Erythrobacter sp.]|nr:SPOR domain-containing protein [Erythrobacter sp.]
GLVYFVSNYNRGPVAVPDGSLIEAPEGPYKERPEEAGGKQFVGTGDVAPWVGHGEAPDSRMADAAGAGSGDQNLNVTMPAIDGAPTAASQVASNSPDPQTAPPPAPTPPQEVEGVGVQVGAYSSRARAQTGWRTLQRQSSALSGVKNRIIEGQSDGGSVFRLQAVAPTLAEANALCRTLRSQGLDCQVKP